MSLDCPLCNKKDSIKFCQDSMSYYNFDAKTKRTSFHDTLFLDNCWFECIECNKTSQDNSKLEELYNQYF